MQNHQDSKRKSEGEISDKHVQTKDDRRAVQKRTFTRWMNVFLQRHNPPFEVYDLFTDIQDGRILMVLLEELSGCKLLYRFRSSSHRIFRLNNISKALAFLDDRHVKLIGIDASGIVDGTPSVVLNLVWNIILHFQVKEVSAGLQRYLSSSLSSLSSCSDLSPQTNDIGSFSSSTLPSKGRKAARVSKYHGKAIKTLLQWIQRCTSKYGVEVNDFGKSWRSGLAFLALIKSIKPDSIDLRESLSREPKENIQHAFTMAHHSLDIPPLLDPEDVTCTSPDEQSIITYVSMFLGHHADTDVDNTTDTEVPDIPNFVSPESFSFGETLADDLEAQALLKALESSREQQLWRQWSRRSSGSLCCTSLHSNGAVTSDLSSTKGSITEQPAVTSTFDKMKRKVLQPPSPLDTRVSSLEIRSWMEKGLDQSNGKGGMDESHNSLSSEETIHSLSALDSDEEDAYSYILDLNKDVFQPYYRVKRQGHNVEEEMIQGMSEVSKHLEACETFDGGKHQEGHFEKKTDIDLESNVVSQSAVDRKLDLDDDKSIRREMISNRAVFEQQPGAESKKKESEEERVVRGQRSDDDDGDSCEKEGDRENMRLVKEGNDKAENNTVKAKMTEVVKGEKEGGGGGELSEKWGHMSEQRTMHDDLRRFEEERNVRQQNRGEVLVKEESVNLESIKIRVNEKILIHKIMYEVKSTTETKTNTKSNKAVKMDLIETCKDEENREDTVINTAHMNQVQRSDGKETSRGRPCEATSQKDTVNIHDGCGNIWTPACSETSQTLSEPGFSLQSLAASCDITPLELQMLLFLWILLYSCLIVPQMNLR